MHKLATLYALRQYLGLADGDTTEDRRLRDSLDAATAAIERAVGRHFTPRIAAITHPINRHEPSELLLDDDLLAITSLADGSGDIPASDYLLLPDAPPYSIIRLLDGRAFTWTDAPFKAITVSGTWGWHDNWPDAFRDSGDTVGDDPLSDSATTITVTDADGADSTGESPRFQVGHSLKIDDEFLTITAVDSSTNTLTVLRGVRGSTAASHTAATPIHVYQPPVDVVLLCLRWAAWLYKEPDGRAITGLPSHLLRGLDALRRVGVR